MKKVIISILIIEAIVLFSLLSNSPVDASRNLRGDGCGRACQTGTASSQTSTLTSTIIVETETPTLLPSTTPTLGPSNTPSLTPTASPSNTPEPTVDPPTGEENILNNAFFEDPNDPTLPSLDGWVNDEGLFACSRKWSPGSPNDTAAAWGAGPVQGGCDGGWSGPNDEGYLRQPISIDPEHTNFYFEVWSIRKGIEIAEVLLICDGDIVWTPITTSMVQGADKRVWTLLSNSMVLPEGLDNCELDFHGKNNEFGTSWKISAPFLIGS